jgi:flavodoxin
MKKGTKTAILFYSRHHGNTKKLLDAIAAADPDVDLVDVTTAGKTDLSGYDRIGIASGIYYSSFAKQVLTFAKENLPEGKPVFFIYTHGAPAGSFLKGIRTVTESRQCKEIGAYRCQGFDTFGPFKLVGGIAKGHPTKEEIDSAVKFYRKLPEK